MNFGRANVVIGWKSNGQLLFLALYMLLEQMNIRMLEHLFMH